jgi:hypothetical protein
MDPDHFPPACFRLEDDRATPPSAPRWPRLVVHRDDGAIPVVGRLVAHIARRCGNRHIHGQDTTASKSEENILRQPNH